MQILTRHRSVAGDVQQSFQSETSPDELQTTHDLLCLIDMHFRCPCRMTRGASCRCVVQRVAIETSDHCVHALHVGHHLHLADISVTHLTLHAGVQMSSMAPLHSRQDGINAHPGNRGLRLVVRHQLLDRRPVLAERSVALHAGGRSGEGHEPSTVGIRVAFRALQTQRQVRLVTIRKRLLRRGERHGRVVHVLASGLIWRY